MTTSLNPVKEIRDFWTRNRGVIVLWASCGLLVVGFLYYYYLDPVLSAGPKQPISFSHRIHAGVKGISCVFCHPYVSQSRFPGIPPVEKCLYCHQHIIANHPEIKKEHAYFNTGTPTPWQKANYLPEHVLFNHARHIRGDIQCAQCHGRIETRDRIKGVNFQMGFCVECHRQKKANLDCWLACHS